MKYRSVTITKTFQTTNLSLNSVQKDNNAAYDRRAFLNMLSHDQASY